MVKWTWLRGPNISSTLPMGVCTLVSQPLCSGMLQLEFTLFSRKIGALKYGTLGFLDSQTISPSQACRNSPSSSIIRYNASIYSNRICAPMTAAGGPYDCWKPPRPEQKKLVQGLKQHTEADEPPLGAKPPRPPPRPRSPPRKDILIVVEAIGECRIPERSSGARRR
jgi:hypothetical protein